MITQIKNPLFNFPDIKYPYNLLLILLLGLCLRVYVSRDNNLHTWDEKFHALVASHLIEHPLKPTLYENPVLPYDCENWVANHIWLEKGPIPLWSIGFSISIFGKNAIAVRIPSIILSLLGIYLTFLIGKKLFNQKTGLFAAFFYAINGLLIEIAGGRVSSDHVEMFFIFFVELAIYLSILTIQKKEGWKLPVLVGIATGMAFLSKWSPALIVFPVWITGELIKSNKSKGQVFFNLSIAVVSFLICILPALLYVSKLFPDEAMHVLRKFFFAYLDPVEQHNGPIYYYFEKTGMVYGEMIWIALVIIGYVIVKLKSPWELSMLAAWIIIPFIIFSVAATKRHTYMLISAPAIFSILGYVILYLKEQKTIKKWIRITAISLLVLLPVRYSIERVKPFEKVDRNPAWVKEIKSLQGKYSRNTIFVNEEHYIEAMFYTDYIFYDRKLSKEEIDFLEKKNYKVISR
ncbi:MAG TPA: glycosyltransferase family 39 protein [Lentimicrobium sp.]|nr:glycosyltransferase family 39 protein [Lentimicrobium sp.]